MSAAQIYSEIARFLSSPDPGVLCIKGAWGVGKTYAWNTILRQCQADKHVSLNMYSYVSLFGLSSITEVKNAIVEKGVDSRAKRFPDMNSYQDAFDLMMKGVRRGGGFASLLPQTRSYAEGVQRLMYTFMSPRIICIDDLERAGSGLTAKDILGLASNLNEERRCKVAILLNDEMLKGENQNEFRSQLEKVADVTLNFDLTPEEAADIAVGKGTLFCESLKRNSIKLGLVNIRVIRKAEYFLRTLQEILSDVDQRVLNQAAHTITIACFAKFQPDIAPSLGEIISFNPFEGLADDAAEEPQEEVEQDTRQIIRNYGITHIDEFDRQLIDGVNKGLFDREEVRRKGDAVNKNLKKGDMTEEYSRAWELFRSSFSDNQQELLETLDRVTRTNVTVVDPPNLNSVVKLFRRLGDNGRADNLVEFYVSARGDEDIFDLEAYEAFNKVDDSGIRSAFMEKMIPMGSSDPLMSIRKIGEKQSWSDVDEDVLYSLSADDFYDIFKRETGDALGECLMAVRYLRRVRNLEEKMVSVRSKMQDALVRIADETPLNKFRVEALLS